MATSSQPLILPTDINSGYRLTREQLLFDLYIIYVKLKPSALPANTAPRLSPLLGAVLAGIAVSFSGDEKDKLLTAPP